MLQILPRILFSQKKIQPKMLRIRNVMLSIVFILPEILPKSLKYAIIFHRCLELY